MTTRALFLTACLFLAFTFLGCGRGYSPEPPTDIYSIEGTVTGEAGVTVSLTGTATTSVVSGSDGKYKFESLRPGHYAVTPSKTGFVFIPPSRQVTIEAAIRTGINFTATPEAIVISGTLNGAETGITLLLSSEAAGSVVMTVGSETNGEYAFIGVDPGTYRIIPSTDAYLCFDETAPGTPEYRTVTVGTMSASGQDMKAYSLGDWRIKDIGAGSAGLYCVDVLGNTVVIGGAQGKLFISNNAGTTFSPLDSGVTRDIRSISFTSTTDASSFGFMDSAGNLFTTSNGGGSFSAGGEILGKTVPDVALPPGHYALIPAYDGEETSPYAGKGWLVARENVSPFARSIYWTGNITAESISWTKGKLNYPGGAFRINAVGYTQQGGLMYLIAVGDEGKLMMTPEPTTEDEWIEVPKHDGGHVSDLTSADLYSGDATNFLNYIVLVGSDCTIVLAFGIQAFDPYALIDTRVELGPIPGRDLYGVASKGNLPSTWIAGSKGLVLYYQ